MKYTEIAEGIEARIENKHLYVRVTSMVHGCLAQGGRWNRVIKTPFEGSLEDAEEINEKGLTAIEELIDDDNQGIAEVVAKGYLIE